MATLLQDRLAAASEQNEQKRTRSVAIWRNNAHAAEVVGLPPRGSAGRETLRPEFAMDAIPRSPNHLLAALPSADFERLRPQLKLVELVQETVLVAAGDRLARVFFPHNGVISLVVSLAGGGSVEVAMVGCDSVFGASAALDGNISLTDAIVQLPGAVSTLKSEFCGPPPSKASRSAPRSFDMNRRSSRRLSSPPHAMQCIQLKPVWHAGYCACTI